MGRLDPASLRSELRDALKGVGPGQISSVIRIQSGFAILKVLSESEATNIEQTPGQRLGFLNAEGSIRYMQNVSGIGEAESAMFQVRKPPGWTQDLQQICETRRQTLANATEKMEAALSSPERLESVPPADLLQEYYALGELYAYQGKMDLALQQYLKSYEVAASRAREALPEIDEELGVAYLHKSEMDNDIYRDPGDRCLLPIHSGMSFARKDASLSSIDHFLSYLKHNPNDYGARWLLNLAYMTVGAYPEKVPSKYLLPPDALQSKESVPRFKDVASQTGLKLFSMAGGLIVDDFENNGLLDVVTSSFDMCEHMHYFHNNGDGTFSDRTEKAGLMDQLGGLNMIQADYNNDGCTDILVLRGGWEVPMRKSLLRNNCDGTFTDVTASSGLAEPATATQTAVWADINNDGWLDLFVGSESGPPQLFLNNHDGTFKDISHAAGIDRVAFTKGVGAADYDGDGYVDFYLSNIGNQNFLYRNNHDNTFSEVGQQAGVPGPDQGFATWFFDYDNDGWPDLFVTSYFRSVDESARTFFGVPYNAQTLKLYKNLGNGAFRDVTAEAGLDKVLMPMGANFGDIDNDGFLDIYLGSGNPSYSSLVPYRLYRNHDGKYFVDVTASSGTGELHKGHSVSFADIARNGKEDILTLTGGAVPGDAHMLRFFENPGNGNDWINLKLVGVKSNRSAIGARIRIDVQNEGGSTRSIYRTVGSGSSFGGSPLEQHIGLGKSARILRIEIWWPASNTRQTFANIEKNQFLQIKELEHDYTKLQRTKVQLGGSPNMKAAMSDTRPQTQE